MCVRAAVYAVNEVQEHWKSALSANITSYSSLLFIFSLLIVVIALQIPTFARIVRLYIMYTRHAHQTCPLNTLSLTHSLTHTWLRGCMYARKMHFNYKIHIFQFDVPVIVPGEEVAFVFRSLKTHSKSTHTNCEILRLCCLDFYFSFILAIEFYCLAF